MSIGTFKCIGYNITGSRINGNSTDLPINSTTTFLDNGGTSDLAVNGFNCTGNVITLLTNSKTNERKDAEYFEVILLS